MLEFDMILYASPVYWYAMSAQMKTFFDRLSDLVTIRKDLGRRLKNKLTGTLSTGAQQTCPSCFSAPFELTAKYFDMHYLGNYYCHYADGYTAELNQSLMRANLPTMLNQLSTQAKKLVASSPHQSIAQT